MSDDQVRDVGAVLDMEGAPLLVSVDYDSVMVGPAHGYRWRLNDEQAQLFAGFLAAACWQAGINAATMAAEARDDV